MRHFDCNHLALGTRNIVLGKLKNLCVTVTLLTCFILYLMAISKYKPPGAYIRRGDLSGGFLRCEFGGLIFGGAYFRNCTLSVICFSKYCFSLSAKQWSSIVGSAQFIAP